MTSGKVFVGRLGIINRMRMDKTGMRRRDEFCEPPFTMEFEKTGERKEYVLDANEEWCLSAKIAVLFWANSVQVNDAVKIAERALLNRLYGETLGYLAELRLAISNGDRNTANSICGIIEQQLIGEATK